MDLFKNKHNGRKCFISINDTKYNEQDMLDNKQLYDVLNNYKDYNLNSKDQNEINKRVRALMKNLRENNLMCQNYQDFVDNMNCDSVEDIDNYSILQCLALITFIQRKDYWSGGYDDVYYEYTTNNILPSLITKIINIYLENNQKGQ